jgi:hypothetical protein
MSGEKMTPDQLRTAGMALYGPEWQSPLARALGVGARAVRKWLAGETPVPSELAGRIRALMGVGDHLDLDRAWPRDEWISGEGMPRPDGSRIEYLIHARHPRFMARIAADEPGLDLDADRGTGVTYGSDIFTICEIVWIDAPPGPSGLTSLMEAACDALEALVIDQ